MNKGVCSNKTLIHTITLMMALMIVVWSLLLSNVYGQTRPGEVKQPVKTPVTPKKTTASPKRTTGKGKPVAAKPSSKPGAGSARNHVSAQARLKRIKDWIQYRGMDDSRIITVDGGLREESMVEVWLVPAGAKPPTANPTVARNEAMLHHPFLLQGFFEQQTCPSITVTSFDSAIEPGTLLTFTANVIGADNYAPTYNWSVSSGTIESGQGTLKITVSTSGLSDTIITVTLELGRLPAGCITSTSGTAIIASRPQAMKVDEFGYISSDDEKARLDNLFIQLQNDPTAQGYVIAYGGRGRR